MRGVDPGTGEVDCSGLPQASQRRDDANRQPYFAGERPLVSAISSRDQGGRDALLLPGVFGGPEPSDASSPQPAAELLAAVARMLSSSHLTTRDTAQDARAGLARTLNELEAQLHERGPAGGESIKNVLAELQEQIQSLARRQTHAQLERAGGGFFREAGSEPVANQTSSARKESGRYAANISSASDPANSLHQFDRLAHEVQRSLARVGGPKPHRLSIGPDHATRLLGREPEAAPEVNPAEVAQMRAQTQEIRGLLSAQVAMLAKNLESQRCERPIPKSDELGSAAKEILELLKDPSRGDAMRTIELRLDTLVRKVEEAIGKIAHAPDDEALFCQIDAAHRQLAARLEAGLAATSIDMGTIKDLLRDVANAIEPARNSKAHQKANEDLEREISRLAERLDRVGEGFEQFQATASTPLQGMSLDDAHAIMREIADLRSLHDETGRRAHLVLANVQDTVGQVADRLAKLETSLGEMQAGRRRSTPANADPFAPFFAFLAERRQDNTKPALAARKSSKENTPAKPFDDRVQGAAKSQTEKRMTGAQIAADPDHFLIEPGLGYPGRASKSEEGASRTEFIAAARRAGRTAQMELRGAKADSLVVGDPGPEPRLGFFRHNLSQLLSYQRPVAWSVVVLFVALGTYVVARTLTHHNLSDLAPNVLKQSGKADVHAAPSSPAPIDAPLGKTLATDHPPAGQGSGAPTAGSKTAPSQGTKSQGAGNQPAAAGSNGAIAALLDPAQLAPPSDSGSASSIALPTQKSVARVIVGGDAIVVSTIGGSAVAGKAPPPVAQILANVLPFASSPLNANPASATPVSAPLDARPAKTLVEQAEAGDAAAQFELAVRFAEGKDRPQNYGLAAQWYEKAAQQGLAAAEYRLGSLYERGYGVAKDLQRAKTYYQRAAEKGNIRAMHNLGVLAAEGPDGQPDYAAAALWFGKAADYGVRDSQYNLAVLLARGLGVAKDLVKSYTWFAVVAASGDEDAAKKRDDVAARLTTSELAAANATAAGFKPYPMDRAANEPVGPDQNLKAVPTLLAPPKISGL